LGEKRSEERRGPMRIKLATIWVDDQDAAREFYGEKLGFKIHTDLAYGPEGRWLTVVSPEDPTVELLLALPDGPAKALQDHLRNQGTPAQSFVSDDIQAEYDALVARGVDFKMPPTRMDYGGTDAVFEDGCGNLLNLHQDE
jgi:catechol 2,3-dioxygenase-like lactoylglutathione lyase family enzyme